MFYDVSWSDGQRNEDDVPFTVASRINDEKLHWFETPDLDVGEYGARMRIEWPLYVHPALVVDMHLQGEVYPYSGGVEVIVNIPFEDEETF